MTLPSELNAVIIIESVVNVLNLTYNMFADSLYTNSKSLQLILAIDNVLYNKFIRQILEMGFHSAEQLLSEEFTKI